MFSIYKLKLIYYLKLNLYFIGSTFFKNERRATKRSKEKRSENVLLIFFIIMMLIPFQCSFLLFKVIHRTRKFDAPSVYTFFYLFELQLHSVIVRHERLLAYYLTNVYIGRIRKIYDFFVFLIKPEFN